MSCFNELREELEEEGDGEQTDVHAVDIGIGGHDHLIITQVVESILYVESRLKEIELLVLVDHLLGQTETVEGLSAK